MTPQERLVKALERYWPGGCSLFKENWLHPDIVFYGDWCVCHTTPERIAIMASVAACHWRGVLTRLNEVEGDHSHEVAKRADLAADEFQQIYDSAQAGEAKR